MAYNSGEEAFDLFSTLNPYILSLNSTAMMPE